MKPVIEVDAVTMRHDAIFQDIQASGREHRPMGALPRIASIHEAVGQKVPGLRAVNIPLHTRMHCYLSIRKAFDSDPTRAAFAAFNTEGGRTPRMSSAVIVDATKPAPLIVFPPRARVPEAAVRAVDAAAVTDVTSTAELPWQA